MFCHTLNGCPTRTSRKSSTSGTRQRPTPRIRGVVAHKPLLTKKSTVESQRAPQLQKVIGPCQRKLLTKCKLVPHPETLDLQSKGNFDEEGKTSPRLWCQHYSMENVIGTTFFVCGAKQQNLSNKHNGASSDFIQAGFEHIQSLTQLEIRPQKPRGNIHGQSGAQL